MSPLYGGIEAGGTKFVCLVASGPDDIKTETRFPTTSPEETLAQAILFFKEQMEYHQQPLAAIGVACFGPVDLNESSPTFGSITTTPKPGWKNTPVVRPLQDAFHIPVAFDTDVNGAAVGEGMWGAAKGLSDFLYLTIGTGVGGGMVGRGSPTHGLVHTEMGHIRMPHDRQRDPFAGVCPYHGDCFEGLACGPAIQQRWGQPGSALPIHHPAWDLEADYIAAALQTFICTLSPKRIILGGGVMQQEHLLPMVRQKTLQLLNNYIASPAILDHIDEYIVAPGLGNQAGSLGAIAMARTLVGDLS